MTDFALLTSLRRTHDGPATALDGVTIGIAAGSCTAFLGPGGPGGSSSAREMVAASYANTVVFRGVMS
ncbi:hypothetical protein AB0K35_03650 [Micromonospora sp. NPDC053740]|uniref:hypothetical protein n=1 Tax=Micromonospora sp. NPDC053740 TaxID=3155173 RepID=UPI00342DDC9A